jgi:hypothetical protein
MGIAFADAPSRPTGNGCSARSGAVSAARARALIQAISVTNAGCSFSRTFDQPTEIA